MPAPPEPALRRLPLATISTARTMPIFCSKLPPRSRGLLARKSSELNLILGRPGLEGRGDALAGHSHVVAAHGYRMASSGDDDQGGQGCSGQREVAHPRSVQSVSQDMIERHVAGAGEREGCGAPPENGRILEAAFAVEKALVDVHGRGHDHRASHRSTGAGRAEPDREQGSPAGFSKTEAVKSRAGPLETRAGRTSR